MRYGFFGGTFNPVHLGHLALARQALSSLRLDHLWWLPANPWQKDSADLMPEADRLHMLELTLADETKMSVDTRELRRVGLSYSIDTVRELAQTYRSDDRFYLIGADQWENFHTWKNWQEIFSYINLVVFSRSGEFKKSSPEVSAFIEKNQIDVKFLKMPALAIESRRIRELLSDGKIKAPVLKTMLSEKVLSFLQTKAAVKA